jgi:glycosyltransferase involved in cell wall biosynthesis
MEFADSPGSRTVQGPDPSNAPKVSIVINNYNYGRFLLQAIDSALAQDDGNIEIIVVDDGSTDDSASIARSRASTRLLVIEKPNGGQASAINVGFAASTGEWVMFLDSDDWYERDAVRTLRSEFRDGISKVHFALKRHTGAPDDSSSVFPLNLSRGDVIPEIAETGNYIWPPTSGNIFRRETLDKIMPIPEEDFKICADVYLCFMVAAHGTIGAVDRPLGHYRVHGNNAYAQTSLGLQKKYLYIQSMAFLQMSHLTSRILREKGIFTEATLLDRRENLEFVAIATRFGAIRLEDFGFSKEKLTERWNARYHESTNTLRSRMPAFLIWNIINRAPLGIVRVTIRILWGFRRRRAIKRRLARAK